MRQTNKITEAMQELLIPTLELSSFNRLVKENHMIIPVDRYRDFGNLQTFPHVGDLVEMNQKLVKVKSIFWDCQKGILISPTYHIQESIQKIYPILITPFILAILGFQYDKKYNKFRLRLASYPDVVLEPSVYHVDDGFWYVKHGKPIRYVHELQAILRVFKIDQGILDCELNVDYNIPDLDWVNNLKI